MQLPRSIGYFCSAKRSATFGGRSYSATRRGRRSSYTSGCGARAGALGCEKCGGTTSGHSFASQLATAGVPLRQVQDWLGHSTINMTMRYGHLAPGGGANLIRAVELPGVATRGSLIGISGEIPTVSE